MKSILRVERPAGRSQAITDRAVVVPGRAVIDRILNGKYDFFTVIIFGKKYIRKVFEELVLIAVDDLIGSSFGFCPFLLKNEDLGLVSLRRPLGRASVLCLISR